MFDLHLHSLLSDGALLPSEICRRYEEKGFKAIAITDHVDASNIKSNIKSVLDFVGAWPKKNHIKVLSGVELTHLPLEQFAPLAKYARAQGIKIIVAHGETPNEPVLKGTNRAALLADINILSHPGYIIEEDVKLAIKRNIFLEITARAGHNRGNNHVASLATKLGANLIIDTDSHSPENIISTEELKNIGLQAGLTSTQISLLYQKLEEFIKRI
ncbi:MAG: histidinol phosphate phosphatase domain-containing protein [Candidatus Omnitrophota bacterium]